MSSIYKQYNKSIAQFSANPNAYITKLKSSQKAEILTNNNGQPEVAIMSTKTYQRLSQDADYGRSVRQIDKSIDDFKNNRTSPADIVFSRLQNRLA